MYTVRIESGFAAAHFLTNYHGKCENVHGHNYKVRVYVRGTELDSAGMLVDFGIMKRHLKTVMEKLDHHDLNAVPEFRNSPSAERIAEYIFNALCCESGDIRWTAVEVFETDANMARFEP